MTDAPDFVVAPGWESPGESVPVELLPDGSPAKPRGDVVAVESAQQLGFTVPGDVPRGEAYVDQPELSAGLELWVCDALPWGSRAATQQERRTQSLQPRLHRVATLRVVEGGERVSRCRVTDGIQPTGRMPVWIVKESAA